MFSATLSSSSRTSACGTTATADQRGVGPPGFQVIAPPSGVSQPARRLSSVVLPPRDGPTMTTSSPAEGEGQRWESLHRPGAQLVALADPDRTDDRLGRRIHSRAHRRAHGWRNHTTSSSTAIAARRSGKRSSTSLGSRRRPGTVDDRVLRAVVHRPGRQGAVRDHEHLIGDAQHRPVVRRQHEALAPISHRRHESQHGVGVALVELRGRLVGHHQRRRTGHRHGERNPLLLAGREVHAGHRAAR